LLWPDRVLRKAGWQWTDKGLRLVQFSTLKCLKTRQVEKIGNGSLLPSMAQAFSCKERNAFNALRSESKKQGKVYR
jgi:hypothetical protein